jgi:hypothetical protein
MNRPFNALEMTLAQAGWRVAPKGHEPGWTAWWDEDYATSELGVRVLLNEDGIRWSVRVQSEAPEGEDVIGNGEGEADLISLLHSELGQ